MLTHEKSKQNYKKWKIDRSIENNASIFKIKKNKAMRLTEHAKFGIVNIRKVGDNDECIYYS